MEILEHLAGIVVGFIFGVALGWKRRDRMEKLLLGVYKSREAVQSAIRELKG